MIHSLDRPAIPLPKFLRLDRVIAEHGRGTVAELRWYAAGLHWLYHVLFDSGIQVWIAESDIGPC